MKKTLRIKETIAVLIMFCTNINAQDILIDSCGIDNSPFLNQYEIEYFQKAIGLENDLTFKRVLFLSGNYGTSWKPKNKFFSQDCKPLFVRHDYPALQSIILTAEEKLEMGDYYDVIFISWSKIPVSDRNRKKFIKNGKKNANYLR